jgi:hypothetical protein
MFNLCVLTYVLSFLVLKIIFSFKSLFIEVLQGYSAPYSATSIYNTYILSIFINQIKVYVYFETI